MIEGSRSLIHAAFARAVERAIASGHWLVAVKATPLT
jgi:hypothetical protein